MAITTPLVMEFAVLLTAALLAWTICKFLGEAWAWHKEDPRGRVAKHVPSITLHERRER